MPNETPAVAATRPARVLANLSAPRLGFTDPLCLMAQVTAMGIELRKDSGAFWEQSLSRLLYQAVDGDYDFALVMDYDSVFRPADVVYMLNLITSNPDVDVVFPVQYKREGNELILGVDRKDEGAITDHLVPSSIGHFGLTFIRIAALKALPHPWLWSKPGSNGRWDDADKVDADIHFWNLFREHERKACCAWRCVIGHLQQMITWPGEDFEIVHQYAGHYFRDGDAPRPVLDAAAARAGFQQRS